MHSLACTAISGGLVEGARDSHVLGKKARVREDDTLLDSVLRRVGASFGFPAVAYQYRGSGSSVFGVPGCVGPSIM